MGGGGKVREWQGRELRRGGGRGGGSRSSDRGQKTGGGKVVSFHTFLNRHKPVFLCGNTTLINFDGGVS